MIQVFQYSTFKRKVKKLHANEKKDLDNAIMEIVKNPQAGEPKKGDLKGIKVYKFKMANQLTLLAYMYDDTAEELALYALGTHENFYRDLKSK